MMFQARGFEAYNLEGRHRGVGGEGLPYSAPDGSPGHVACVELGDGRPSGPA